MQSSLLEAVRAHPSLTTIILEYQGQTLEFCQQQELAFSLETIDVEITEHAEKTCLVGTLYEMYQHEAAQYKAALRRTESRLFEQWKESEYDPRTGKPFSDDRMEKKVRASEEVADLTQKHLEADRNARLLGRFLSHMEERKELMRTYSANARKTI